MTNKRDRRVETRYDIRPHQRNWAASTGRYGVRRKSLSVNDLAFQQQLRIQWVCAIVEHGPNTFVRPVRGKGLS